jgi:hypothetical protein
MGLTNSGWLEANRSRAIVEGIALLSIYENGLTVKMILRVLRVVPLPSRARIGRPGCDAAPVCSPQRRAATGSSSPEGHESTNHLFAHSRRMMSCAIGDAPGIVEGGRPNQIVGPDHDHGQLGNARTGPRALGDRRPTGSLARGIRFARRPRRAVTRGAADGHAAEIRRSQSDHAA